MILKTIFALYIIIYFLMQAKAIDCIDELANQKVISIKKDIPKDASETLKAMLEKETIAARRYNNQDLNAIQSIFNMASFDLDNFLSQANAYIYEHFIDLSDFLAHSPKHQQIISYAKETATAIERLANSQSLSDEQQLELYILLDRSLKSLFYSIINKTKTMTLEQYQNQLSFIHLLTEISSVLKPFYLDTSLTFSLTEHLFAKPQLKKSFFWKIIQKSSEDTKRNGFSNQTHEVLKQNIQHILNL